jgi:hypothetical protein
MRDKEWLLVEIDLSGSPVVEIRVTSTGLLAVDASDWPE